MKVESIIKKLDSMKKVFPFDAHNAILKQKDEVIPAFLDILDDVFVHPYKYYDNYLHFMVMLYLSYFQVKEAFPKLIKILELNFDDIESLFGDVFFEYYYRFLFSTYNGDLISLCKIINDKNLYYSNRIIALMCYDQLYLHNIIAHQELIAFFQHLIKDNQNVDIDFLTNLCSEIIDLHLIEFLDDIKYLYNNKLIDIETFDFLDVAINDLFDYYDYHKPIYVDDVIAALKKWFAFDNIENDEIKINPNNKYYKFNMMLEELKDYMDDNDKLEVGRNNLCPCGSGKKYKKCCLNKGITKKLEDVYDLLYFYPPLKYDNESKKGLLDCFTPEAIAIDKLVFKALFHRMIPDTIKRNFAQEDIDRVSYLVSALELAVVEVNKESIKSVEQFDQKYMIHYDLNTWVNNLESLLIKNKALIDNNVYDKALVNLKEISNIL